MEDVLVAADISWEGYSDWDDKDIEGSTMMALVKGKTDNEGKLMRSKGYAEEIPSMSDWVMTERGEFLLFTNYEMVSAEEMMTFKTPNFRLRVSSIKTQNGKGITTSSLSTEIRQNKKE
mmetsp:Transcript_3814/g.9169  ORF Transcript_3814/g.9169 Transcript_3814/m.9169 type:complete len:119 (-) Transcript_3814:6-362(-)